MDLVRKLWHTLGDPRWNREFSFLLLAFEVLLSFVIINRIPYTEIDWKAYMQQVSQYIGGERDYTKIHGDTGPLVYPAAHVYVYRLFYSLTDEGRDIRAAQWIFMGVYLAALWIVLMVYRKAGVPPYVLPLLVLSKRLHSIFLLRCFNDCIAVMALFLATYCYQLRLWTLGSIIYSLGLGVKMNLLLVLPAIGAVLFQAVGFGRAIRQAGIMAQIQMALAFPFLQANAQGYWRKAFELNRQFLFKWTVNWRFLGEDLFLSKHFSMALLVSHASLLLIFISTRWLQPSRRSIAGVVRWILGGISPREELEISQKVTPAFTTTTILTANVIGMLCARSLHYQFYSWLAWSTPFLLWRAKLNPILIYVLWFAQEWAWNVYPSTSMSSKVVVGSLAVQVILAWLAIGDADDRLEPSVKVRRKGD